jgi:hypothetical protein
MVRYPFKFDAKVSKPHSGETYAGFVRIHPDNRPDILAGSCVRLTHNGKSVYCEVRHSRDKTSIRIPYLFKGKLGITDDEPPDDEQHVDHSDGPELAFTIEPVGYFGRVMSVLGHPDPVVRVPMQVAAVALVLGLVLGVVGLILGAIPLLFHP